MRPKLLSFLILLLSLAMPAQAMDPAVEAEAERLKVELQRLAQRNKWNGVERTYARIVATGAALDKQTLLVAADAARNRGDVLARIARLVEAESFGPDEEISGTLVALGDRYGRVQLASPDAEPLIPERAPFLPDAQQAIRFAQAELMAEGRFDGFLPAGRYRWGEDRFEVEAGQPAFVLSHVPDEAGLPDLTLKGVSFPRKVSLRGRRLELNGVGHRAKLGIVVYVAALYVSEPSNQAEALIRQELEKRLVMHFVFRETPAAAIRDVFRKGFDKQAESGELDEEIAAFTSCFERPMRRGDRAVFDYVPGRGTRVSINGREVGEVPGQAFGQALFRLFLGEDPPTEKLRQGLLGEDQRM